jgi:hypothetical protein
MLCRVNLLHSERLQEGGCRLLQAPGHTHCLTLSSLMPIEPPFSDIASHQLRSVPGRLGGKEGQCSVPGDNISTQSQTFCPSVCYIGALCTWFRRQLARRQLVASRLVVLRCWELLRPPINMQDFKMGGRTTGRALIALATVLVTLMGVEGKHNSSGCWHC